MKGSQCNILTKIAVQTCVCVHACVTLVPHRVSEFGQVGQQFSLQADWCQAEAPEQGLGSQAVLLVLTEQYWSHYSRFYDLLLLLLQATHETYKKKLNNNTVHFFLVIH